MRYFDVHRRLEESRIPVVRQPLPARTNGLSCRMLDGAMGIVVRDGLTRVEEYCTLVHEYYHLKLFRGEVFSFHDTYRLRLEGDRIEYEVRKATARRLVPFGQVRKMVRRGDEIHDIAETLDVTVEVLLDAFKIMNLRAEEAFLFAL